MPTYPVRIHVRDGTDAITDYYVGPALPAATMLRQWSPHFQ